MAARAFRRILAACRRAPVVSGAAVILCAAELVAILVAPRVLRDGTYLRLYLGSEARGNMQSLLADSTSYVVYDALTGWRNRPDARHGRWQVGPDGARRTGRSAGENGQRQVWFFGDSMTNGGTGVGGDETIAAYLEAEGFATVNHGTMLFGVDQSCLLARERLAGGAPSAIVLGVSENSIQALGNRFVPFRLRIESGMPYLKPRFVLAGTELGVVPTPSRDAYADLLGAGGFLSELSSSDDYYVEFARYRRFGLLPIADGLCAAWRKGESARRALAGDDLATPLLLALLEDMAAEARRAGSGLVVLLLPTRAATDPPRWRRLLPDRHAALARDLRNAGLCVVDGRDALVDGGRPVGAHYHPDGVHYTRSGNLAIATALAPVVLDQLSAGASARVTPAPLTRTAR